ncbi:hypothetical protein LWI29_016168 [Acer saccharum]|uniref:Uncharacterized protein n=1 Tax=Acer saccharum TaxID=4024 RepID=A0AA39TKX1_ACESA|nr:hypothetical protein LWI29_016168 [Acer saccharum]
MVLLIVNYDGQWEDGQFNPKAVFFLSVTVKETLKTLAEKICSRFGLNSDGVDFKISTRIDGSIVEMIYDLDLQIFVSHNKENPKCYVSVFHKQLRSLVDQLTVTRDLKSKCTSITIGCTGDQACTPPPIVKCKSIGSPVVSSSGYRSTTGSNEFVPSVSKKFANRSNHGNYAKDEKVHCPTVVTAEDEEGGMGCSANINSPLCPCSNEISPQDLPLRPTHDDNPLHLIDLGAGNQRLMHLGQPSLHALAVYVTDLDTIDKLVPLAINPNPSGDIMTQFRMLHQQVPPI